SGDRLRCTDLKRRSFWLELEYRSMSVSRSSRLGKDVESRTSLSEYGLLFYADRRRVAYGVPAYLETKPSSRFRGTWRNSNGHWRTGPDGVRLGCTFAAPPVELYRHRCTHGAGFLVIGIRPAVTGAQRRRAGLVAECTHHGRIRDRHYIHADGH